MKKYYYQTEKGRFDGVICTEDCSVKEGIKIGSENCSKCEHFFNGSAGIFKQKGWIQCKAIKTVDVLAEMEEERIRELLRLHLKWWMWIVFILGRKFAIRVLKLKVIRSTIHVQYPVIGIEILKIKHIHDLRSFKVWMKLK